jgi:serine/alanine adding enzyme
MTSPFAGRSHSSTDDVRNSAVDVPSVSWLRVLEEGLGYKTYLLSTNAASGATTGRLPLALVESRLFGRFLVSLPYVNSAGVMSATPLQARNLVDQAVQLADELDVRYLELRQETPIDHPALTGRNDSKVILRLALPPTADALWNQLKAKVRNQIRKGRTFESTVHWGGAELLPEFYDVFSRNLRDLGTPVYGRSLFAAILREFAGASELCVVRREGRPISAALLCHGIDGTEVPSAAALRTYNPTNVNMLMYWHLLERAIARGSRRFDFGRSTVDSNTFRFKLQWGAEPFPSCWQYYVRRGTLKDMRPDQGRFQIAIRVWQRLPLSITRWLGPHIVRGIP